LYFDTRLIFQRCTRNVRRFISNKTKIEGTQREMFLLFFHKNSGLNEIMGEWCDFKKFSVKMMRYLKKPNYYKNRILVPMDKATSYTNWWANHCTVRLTVLPYFVFEKKKKKFYRGALVRMIKHKIRLKIKRAHTFQMHHQRERLRGAKGHHSNGKEIIYCTYDIIKVGECKSTETWHDRKESNWIARE
jgi:hypothetical protein